MRLLPRAAITVVVFAMLTTTGHAIPHLINYQGVLLDGGGNPVTTLTSVEFRIWSMSAGGSQLWSETRSITPNSTGTFTVLLGEVTSIPESAFATDDAYLGITVSGEPEMTPRSRLVSVGYAYRTNTVDGATGGNIISTVTIGTGHSAPGAFAFTAGQNNGATGEGAAVSGGSNNVSSGVYSNVGGGINNTAVGDYSAVSGGNANLAAGHANIGGGGSNTATGAYSTIAGGNTGTANASHATVGGGAQNTASGNYSTVAGGMSNSSDGGFSATAGGRENKASGDYSCVPGGYLNTATGLASFAAGRSAKALHDGCFVWASDTLPPIGNDYTSTAPNQFLIRADGGVGIMTDSPGGALDVGGTLRVSHRPNSVNYGTGGLFCEYDSPTNTGFINVANTNVNPIWGNIVLGWSTAPDTRVGIGTETPNFKLDVRGTIGNNATLYHSDRRWKTRVRPLESALEQVQQLKGVSYEWKRDEFPEMQFPKGRHIGVIAQDVESVIPEVVHTADDGYKSVEYAKLVAVLIEAVKELKADNDELRAIVEGLTASR